MNNQLIPEKVHLNEVEPEGFCAPGKSLISEVEKLRGEVNAMRNAILRLIDLLQRQSTAPLKEEVV